MPTIMGWASSIGFSRRGLHVLGQYTKLLTHRCHHPPQLWYSQERSILARRSRIKVTSLSYSTQTDPSITKAPEETVLHRLQRIEKSLKFRGYSILRIGGGILLCTGIGVYLFRDHLRNNVADEVSTVASQALEDETVKLKAEELSKALLQAILNDQIVKAEAVRFLSEVIKSPETQAVVIQLLINLFNDSVTQRKLTSLLKQLVSRALSDPAFRHNLAVNLKDLFDDKTTRDGLVSLMQHILRDEIVREEAKMFVKDVLSSQQVNQETAKLGKTALKDVIADSHLQKKTGDAMWSAFTYSITPSWFGWKSTSAEDTNETKPGG